MGGCSCLLSRRQNRHLCSWFLGAYIFDKECLYKVCFFLGPNLHCRDGGPRRLTGEGGMKRPLMRESPRFYTNGTIVVGCGLQCMLFFDFRTSPTATIRDRDFVQYESWSWRPHEI